MEEKVLNDWVYSLLKLDFGLTGNCHYSYNLSLIGLLTNKQYNTTVKILDYGYF
jgi:hypothetical protein